MTPDIDPTSTPDSASDATPGATPDQFPGQFPGRGSGDVAPVRPGHGGAPLSLSPWQLRMRQGMAGAFVGLGISLVMAVSAGLNWIVFCGFGTCTGASEVVNRATAVVAVAAPMLLGVRGLLRHR